MNGAILSDELPGPVTLCYSEGGGKKKFGSKGQGQSQALAVRATPYGGNSFMGDLGRPMFGFEQQQFGKGMGKGGQGGPGSILELKKELEADGVLPGGQWSNDDGALHIGGLPYDTTDKDVYEIFAPFGAIASKGLKAMTHPDGSCTGVAFVNFLSPAAAQAAINALNGRAMKDGKTIHVKVKRKQAA
eukprot:UN0865